MEQKHDKDVEALTKLGLTFLQAKVYLALANSISLTIREISKTAKVARQDLYRITSELQKLGLVERVLTTPTEFRAVELTSAVSILLQRIHKKEAERQKQVMELLQRHKDGNSKVKTKEMKPLFIMVPEKEDALRAIKALENAETSMVSVISLKKFLSLILNTRKFRLTNALKRGVKLRFIIEKPEDEMSMPKIVETYRKKYSFEIRYLPAAPPAHLGLFDKKEVFINTSTEGGLAKTPILWSNSPGLIAVVHDYFEILWLTAMDEYKASKKLVKIS